MTEDEYKVMAFMVEDPDAWLQHAEGIFGAERAIEMLHAKVKRHKSAYEKALTSGKFETRAQQIFREKNKQALEIAAAANEGLIREKMREIAIRELEAEGKMVRNG